MAELEDLGYKSISSMNQDEALDLLRQIRLSRRVPDKKIRTVSTSSKAKAKSPEVSADLAARLLEILGGSE